MTALAGQLVASTDGIQIATEPVGAGASLVFAHGLSGHSSVIRLALAPLLDRYRVVLFDQRGHGASTPVTEAALYDTTRMADDMLAVLDAYGIERAVVGGESMGAATALRFALRHPQRVERLLLTAPAFGDTLNAERERLIEMGQNMQRLGMEDWLALAAVRQREQFNWSPELIRFMADVFRNHDAQSLGTALQTVALWQPFPDLNELAQVQCPVCILAWEQDPLHPIELARRYAAVLPQVTFKTMAPLPALFIDPPQVGRIYAEFLEQT